MQKISDRFKLLNSEVVYTRNIHSNKKGKGVFLSDEWANVRRLTFNFFENPNEKNYRLHSYSELEKFTSAFNLCNFFDFSSFSKLGDIGGVPFFQASVIDDLYPHLSFLLTDYDYESCNSFKKFPRFSNHEIQSFNAKKDDYSIFNSCDILTMWGVDYALTDLDLLRLFGYVKKSKKTLLFSSINIDSILFNFQICKVIKFIFMSMREALKFLLRSPKRISRMHGTLRNQKYFKKLANISGVKLKIIKVESPTFIINLYNINPGKVYYKVVSN